MNIKFQQSMHVQQSFRLEGLRHMLAGLDPTLAPHLPGSTAALPLGIATIDRALGGGLSRETLHELAPATPVDLGAATGFAAALAALANAQGGEVLWIATDSAGIEAGRPYGPGLDAFGMTALRLVTLCVPCPLDVLWAMEEALRCRALAAVIAELAGGETVDLTQTRRLALAARGGGSFGVLLRHRPSFEPNAATTRWRIAAGRSRSDRFGGLGPAGFDLALVKNRRGPSGRWLITWDRHECVFHEAVSLGVAAAAFDRSDRTPSRRAG